MPKTYNNLYPKIYDYDNLYNAFRAASRAKQTRPEVLKYEWNLEENLINLQNHLIYKSWNPHKYRHFTVYEPKRRDIDAPQFEDRIIHHALCQIIEPLFEKRFVESSFACRQGKGTHAAVLSAEKCIRSAARIYRAPYIFKGDVSKYFYSIKHEVLKRQYRRTISCSDTLWLMDKITDCGGHDGVAVPIGALTSQLYANIMLDPLDHYAKDKLGIRRYVRYMDDFIAIADNKDTAREYWWRLQNFVEFNLELKLNPKSCIQPLSKGLNFCGYRIWPGYRLPRKRNVRRMRKRLRKMVNLYKKQKCTSEAICQSWQSFLGYMKHCKSHDTVVGIYEDLQKQLKEE